MRNKIKRFSRAYIEITNSCNLSCPFCPGTTRPAKFIEFDKFAKIASQAQPLADYIYLHVMGEPLLHPKFEKIIFHCQEIGLPVEIVTNGTRFNDINTVLFNPIIKQINISFHALQDNIHQNKRHLDEIISFTHKALACRPDLYLNFRFWILESDSDPSIYKKLSWLIFILKEEFGYNGDIIPKPNHKSIKILNRLYLHFDQQFTWPEIDITNKVNKRGQCLALSQQFAILVDGTVVPCCLDRNGSINLGNCLTTPLQDILNSARATQMLEGFKKKELIETLCQHCSYCSRFEQ